MSKTNLIWIVSNFSNSAGICCMTVNVIFCAWLNDILCTSFSLHRGSGREKAPEGNFLRWFQPHLLSSACPGLPDAQYLRWVL